MTPWEIPRKGVDIILTLDNIGNLCSVLNTIYLAIEIYKNYSIKKEK